MNGTILLIVTVTSLVTANSATSPYYFSTLEKCDEFRSWVIEEIAKDKEFELTISECLPLVQEGENENETSTD